MTEARCETCALWTRDREGVEGECRRRAPHGLPYVASYQNGVATDWRLQTSWPTTNAGACCGEHRAIEPVGRAA